MKKISFFFSVLFLLFSCRNAELSTNVELIRIKPLLENGTKVTEMIDYLSPFQEKLSEQMEKRLGFSVTMMSVGRPESLLSNLICEVLLQEANSFRETDFAVYNMGGIRKFLPQGEISLRTIYEILPFDNQLVIVQLLGYDVEALCHSIAKVGGEGVAGISFCIENGVAKDIKIQGVPLDIQKVYSVATNDYLSFGNDKMEPLANYSNIVYSNLQIRDIFIRYVVDLNSRGEYIVSKLDRRIYEK